MKSYEAQQNYRQKKGRSVRNGQHPGDETTSVAFRKNIHKCIVYFFMVGRVNYSHNVILHQILINSSAKLDPFTPNKMYLPIK